MTTTKSAVQCRRMKDTMELELFRIFMNDTGKEGRSEVTEFVLTQIYLDLTVLKLMVQVNCYRWMIQRGWVIKWLMKFSVARCEAVHKRKNSSCYPCRIGSKLVIVDFSGNNITVVGRGQKHQPNLNKEMSVTIRKSKMSVGNWGK